MKYPTYDVYDTLKMSASLGCMSKSMGQTARHLTEGGKRKRVGGGRYRYVLYVIMHV